MPYPEVVFAMSDRFRARQRPLSASPRRRKSDAKKASSRGRSLRCELLEDRQLLSGTDINVTSLDWDVLRDIAPYQGYRGVDVGYEVTGADLPAGTQAAFYWASGPTQADAIGGPLSVQTLDSTQGFHQFNESAIWGRAPANASYILVVADPNNAVAETDETNNVAALRIHTPQEILANALTIEQADNFTVRAVFRPGNGLYTMSEAEVVLGVHHFNWVNQVYYPQAMEVRQPSGSGYAAVPGHPYLEPATGVSDLGQLQLYSPLGTPTTEFFGSEAVDGQPLYWNEPASPFMPEMNLDVRRHTDGHQLVFLDSPRVPADFFGPGDHLEFYTQLTGVTPSGAAVAIPGLPWFHWKSNTVYTDRSAGRGVYFVSEEDSALPTPTSGGVFDLATVNQISPIARDDYAQVAVDKTVLINVLGNDSDPSGGALRIVGVGTPIFGSARLDDHGTPNDPTDDRILYTPNPAYPGFDTFQYMIVRENGEPGFATASVTLNVAGPIVGLGVVGDNFSDEYDAAHNYAKSWVQLLASAKGMNFGESGQFSEPRRSGYAFNWARDGATSLTLLDDGQHVGLADQIYQSLVNYAVLEAGTNDFVLGGAAYDGIYNLGQAGGWAQSAIDAYADQVVNNLSTALATLVGSGASVVMTNIADPGLTPLGQLLYPDADRRELVASVIAGVNFRLEQLAILYRVPLVDLYSFDRARFGTHLAPVLSQNIGGVAIANAGGVEGTNAFTADGLYPHTISQALLANLLLEGLHQGYGVNVDAYRFSEQQMLDQAGLAYGGQDTFPLKYANYVILPTTNRAPIAANDSYALTEDVPLSIAAADGVLRNDGDLNGDVLAAVLVAGPAHGTLNLNPDGSFRYAPATNYNGTDTFTYKANDGQANSNVATVVLTIAPVNNVPTAGAQSLTINEDAATAITLTGDGGDPEVVQKLTYTIVRGPAHGTISGFDPATGQLIYTPNGRYNGPDSFTFTVTDDDKAGPPANLTSAEATVSITIKPVNNVPVATAQSASTDEHAPVTITLTGDGGDPEVTQKLTYTIVRGPAHGTISGFDPATGQLIYTPSGHYNGPDGFTFTVTDDDKAGPPANLTSAEATVSITVNPINDPPVAQGQTLFLDEQTPTTVQLSGDDGDPEVQQVLTYAITSGPSHGTLTAFDPKTGQAIYTPEAGYHGADSFTFTVTDDDKAGPPAGLTSAPATVALRVVRPLGQAASLLAAGQNPSAGELWYRFQTVRRGILSLQAEAGSPDGAQLGLYDANGNQLAVSAPFEGNPRIDYPVASPSQIFYLRVTGTAAAADLRLVNLVEQAGQAVTVFGTDAKDQFEFSAAAGRRVVINGMAYELSTAVNAISFDGGASNDSAKLTGSAGNETAKLRPGSATLEGSGFTVTVSDVSDVVVNGQGGSDTAELYDAPDGNDTFVAQPTTSILLGTGYSSRVNNFATVTAFSSGGQDLARLYDSAGDDTFEAHPTYAVLKANDSSYSYRANGFAFVQAYATTGNDTADLYDSAGKDAFTCDLGKKYGELSGTGFYVRANSFPSLTAHATTGDDIARFYDSAGDDQFASFPTYATMTGGGFTGRAENFRYFLGYSTAGNDKATLHDSPQAETYVGAPTWGILFNPSSCYSRVTNFKTTEVIATPGADDLARLYDGPGDDQLVAYPGDVTFSGPGLSQHVLGFRFVQAYATAGGTDQAHFYDSPGQDTFESRPGTASMQSPDNLNRASNFASYRAYSLLGGGDVAKFYDTPGDDTFDGYLSYATMSGQAYSARADGFANVLAYATAGGTDTANFHGTAGAESFLGMSGISRMSNPSYSQTASAFDKVYFLSGGGNDTALVYDTPGDDRLEAGADWARFTSAEQMLYLSALSSSSSVKAYGFSGGTNTKRVAATDYALQTYGTWIDEGP